MEYIKNSIYNGFRNIGSYIMKNSYMPKSVAVIMDGNRRFAKNKNIQKIKGHEQGLTTLLQFCEWCVKLDIKELIAYAFSIDNFNRSEEEVTGIKNLIRLKFKKLYEEKEFFQKLNIKVQIIGRVDYFDQDIVDIFKDVEEKTSKNTSLILKICIAYNSTEEVNRALTNFDFSKNIDPQEEFEKNLYTNTFPDILIRTSGETRLSNFLLYQTRFSKLYFINKNWPEVTFYDLFKIILYYNIDFSDHSKKIKILEEQNILEKKISK